MDQPTPENIRFHAAGHLAAALLVIQSGNAEASKPILQMVNAYVNHEKVSAPQVLKDKVAACCFDPSGNVHEIGLLEQWLCDPLNTIIEKSNGKFNA